MSNKSETGFTIVELVVTISLSAIVMVTLYTVFQSSFFSYLGLQKDASSFTDLAYQSQRVAKVVRGTTQIESAAADEMVFYAYFSPTDDYVSRVRYYLSADSKKLFVDITPMDANPPIGNLLTAKKHTHTIIDNFYKAPGNSLFEYMNSNGTKMTLPIDDMNSIKGVRVNLATPTAHNESSQTISVQVSLRNKKVNL